MRRLLISEAFGLYKVEVDGWTSTGASLDSALHKAYQKATANVRHPQGQLDFKEPALEDLSAADVLEVLLGPAREGGGQIHTGIEHA